MKTDKRRISGLKSKRNGSIFEHMIDRACRYYESREIAYIQKTPEPMRITGRTNRNGVFQAVFDKKAQPDYTGTLGNGISIVFEAKHTNNTNIKFNRIELHQESELDKHTELGAATFILVSFSTKHFYKVPWLEWLNLKETIGKKSVNEKDLKEYEVEVSEGIVKFLD